MISVESGATVRLQAFSLNPSEAEGKEYYDAVTRNADRLQADFPGVVDRNNSPEAARASIERAAHAAQNHAMGYYAVRATEDDAFVGVASYRQQRLWRPGRLSLPAVNGPNVAGWADLDRPEATRGTGAYVLSLLVAEAIKDVETRGYAWTVVRRENRPSVKLVEEQSDPMFMPSLHGTQVWPVGDGVEVERTLYVADTSMRDLRRAA